MSVAADACRNCGANAPGHYCPNCGQETRVALPTFPAFMREAAGRYVALDGRTWRTLWGLVARPGFLTLEYLQGRRRRYIRPARLFLVLYLVLFALIGLVQSPMNIGEKVVFVDTDAEPNPPAAANAPAMQREPGTAGRKPTQPVAGPEGGADTSLMLDEDLDLVMRWAGTNIELPGELGRRYEHFRKLPKEAKAEQLYAGILRYGTYAMVALLPAFAFLQMLAYAGRGSRYPRRPRRYAEHLVYSAHLHAFAALVIIALLLLPFGPLRFALLVWVGYYVLRARQAVYGGRWWAGLLRAAIVATCYCVLVAFAILGLVAAAVMLR
ncbi:MAG: DUF3667 domain-containing protein [Burkholderiales bacterium]